MRKKALSFQTYYFRYCHYQTSQETFLHRKLVMLFAYTHLMLCPPFSFRLRKE